MALRHLHHHRAFGRYTVRAGGRPNSDINVTPLVDVVLVLLIIFMVVTPLLDKMLRVRVPDAEQTEQYEQPTVTQIVVSVRKDGHILINNEEVEDDAYVGKLRRVLAARAPGDRLVFFSAEDDALYQRLVVALDGARQAGAEIMTMTTEPMVAATPAAAPATP
ncbi:MAG TPA: biopolymer transporter ExbD [Anaeromyxobacter sp.]